MSPTPLLIWLYTFAFAAVHSLLVSQAVKKYAYQFGLQIHHYRLLYLRVGVLPRLSGCIVLAVLQPIDGAVFLGLKKAVQQTDNCTRRV
ncbi:hypothetical protein [Ghiorsea bivora]|uniref:hypothetical protein n=1 Tax=Ghiorsea bivora TaxID=1485545 RepID=UPI0012FD1887|nr:hypothetical protein [Ghiorsea bivora]